MHSDGLRRTATVPWVRVALWAAFVVAHTLAGIFATVGERPPFGDVGFVYRTWAEQAVTGGPVPGIDQPWVYPVAALGPVLLPLLGGAGAYTACWLALVVLVDAGAFALLTAHLSRRRVVAASWWMLIVATLGPVAVSRLDAVSAAIAVVGLLIITTRPALASVILTVAVWIKVWPFAILAAALVTVRSRGRILAGAAGTSVAIAAIGLSAGAGWNLLSFVGAQASRGLEIEAPLALPWMWQVAAGVPGSAVYYDRALNTYQVTGANVGMGIAAGTPLLALTVLVIVLLALRAMLAGRATPVMLPSLALGLTTALIIGNKVGSPQYTSWLIPAIVVGLVTTGKRFVVPAALTVGISVATMLDYPLNFDNLVAATVPAVTIVTVRCGLLIVVYVWCIRRLWAEGMRIGVSTPLLSEDQLASEVRC